MTYSTRFFQALRGLAYSILCLGFFLVPGPALVYSQEYGAPASRPLGNRNIPVMAQLRDGPGDLPWRLTADKLVSLDDGVIVEASGDVRLERGNDFLEAQFARFFTATNWVFIQGDVTVRLGRDELTASEAEFDLASNTGWLRDGHVFMDGPHIYFTGDQVIKHWGDRYTFENAKVTACDDPIPAWSVTARRAQVEIDGYATLTGSAFQIKDTSVIGAPWMILPAKTTRQSGLLQPAMGISSRHGAYYAQPLFWALSQDRDMTFYLTWMEKTGVMPSVEYRSKLRDNSSTWMAADFLYDNSLVRWDPHDPVDKSDGKIRTNHVRYWLRGMSDGELGNSPWRYKYNLDVVSDQNTLREFQQQLTGFDNTRDRLMDMFGRDLQEVEKNRISEGYIFRDWNRFRLAVGARYEQDPSLGHGNVGLSTDTSVQILPQLSAFLFKGRLLPDLPLEGEAALTSAYMYRRTGASGMRTELAPRLSLPLDINYGTLLAEAGLRQTFYHNSKVKAVSPLRETNTPREEHFGTSRTIPDVNLTLFTQGNRIWNLVPERPLEASLDTLGQSQWTGLRHTIQPRVEYTWIPNVNQKRIPFYTLDDRILPTNSLYFSLTNLFTVRKQQVVADPVPEGEEAPASASLLPEYQELLRLKVGGGFDFEEAYRQRHRDLYPRRPAMDIMTDLTFNLTPWASLWTQNYVSLYGKGVTRSDSGLTLTSPRWGEWQVGYSTRSREYDYLRQVQYENVADINFHEPLQLLRNEVHLNLTPQWQISALSNYNLRSGSHYEGRVSLSYQHQCYRITGRYASKGREQSYHISIELLGIN